MIVSMRAVVMLSLAAWAMPLSAQGQPGGDTFEAIAARASTPVELGTLVAPFLENCATAEDPLEQARCKGTTRFLRTSLPGQAYLMVVDDSDSITVSEYDARIKGVRLGVVGCLACDEPVAIGKSGQRRLVTLKPPERKGTQVSDGVEVAAVDLTFGGIPESKVWMKQVRPHLRAEFVFQPAGTEWSFGPSRGFAFTLLATRVFNRCTGEVIYAQPASESGAPKLGDPASCSGGDGAGAAEDTLPDRLSAAAINRSMTDLRPMLDECISRYKLRGTAMIEFVVSGHTGIPASVKLDGALGGTTVGQCLIKASRKARFSQFSREEQKFSYPIILRKP